MEGRERCISTIYNIYVLGASCILHVCNPKSPEPKCGGMSGPRSEVQGPDGFSNSWNQYVTPSLHRA